MRPPPTWTVAHLAARVVKQAVLGRDPVVGEHPGLHGAAPIHTAHPVLPPGQRHRRAVDGQVDIVHHRSLFDLGRPLALRTADLAQDLLDHQLHVGTVTRIAQDPDVFEAHQGLDDFTRVDNDEGASWFLAHTKIVERLRLFLGDPRTGGTPPESEEPEYHRTRNLRRRLEVEGESGRVCLCGAVLADLRRSRTSCTLELGTGPWGADDPVARKASAHRFRRRATARPMHPEFGVVPKMDGSKSHARSTKAD